MTRNITPDIIYIGTDDLDIVKFENQYAVPEGMSYNSYLIKGEKTAIMDSTDARTAEQWRSNLLEALDGATPDYFVLQHLEPDHSSQIAWLLDRFPGLKIAASARAVAMIPQFFEGISLEGRSLVMKEGDRLELGGHTLRFVMAPMVHWPEVMVSFEEETGILFSADAFGKFGALSRSGFDSAEEKDWACEARRYYFNICGKYGGPVQTLLKKLSSCDIRTICPLHGPILKDDLGEYLRLYDIWSSYGVETEGVFIACASIHGGTLAAARKLEEILAARGVRTAFNDLTVDDPAEAVEDAFRYGKMVIAASSYDAGLFPPAVSFLHDLQAKAYQNRKVAIIENGSWAPSAARVMREMLSTMKNVEITEPAVTLKSTLKKEDIAALEALAEAISG